MSQLAAPIETMHQDLIIAGYGGQGVLKLGLILVEAAVNDGREVVWSPAYGPEMRGGPSFCTVIISSQPIGAPVVHQVDSAIFLDRPSVAKHQHRIRPTGLALINSSLIEADLLRHDIPVYAVAANSLAEEIGNPAIMNMVLLGALLHLTQLARPQSVIEALRLALPERHQHLIPLNERALTVGAEQVKQV